MIGIETKDKAKKESSFWNRFAKFYDRFMGRTSKDSYKKLFKKLLADTVEHTDLLEIATGTGEISIFLSNYVKNITAIDFAPNMLKIAESKAKEKQIKNICFEHGDCLNLQMKNECFDTVVCVNALHLIEVPDRALQEMNRVLKDEGQIIVATYCHGQSFKAKIMSALMSVSGFKAKSKWSVESYKQFIGDNGFNIKETIVYGSEMPLVYVRAEKEG